MLFTLIKQALARLHGFVPPKAAVPAFPGIDKLAHIPVTILRRSADDKRAIIFLTQAFATRHKTIAKMFPSDAYSLFMTGPTLSLIDALKDKNFRAALRFGVGMDELGINSWINGRYKLPQTESDLTRGPPVYAPGTFGDILLELHYIHTIQRLLLQHQDTHIYVPESSSTLKRFFKDVTRVHCFDANSKVKDWKSKAITQTHSNHELLVTETSNNQQANRIALDTSSLRLDQPGKFMFDVVTAEELMLRAKRTRLSIIIPDQVMHEITRLVNDDLFSNWIGTNLPHINFAVVHHIEHVPTIVEDGIHDAIFDGDSKILYQILGADGRSTIVISNDSLFRVRARNTQDECGHQLNEAVSLKEAFQTILREP
ncbi:hypothetical protein I302_108748 [Kwoniella bestiolae CBS 10118]|uniref:Uncharacterized protein n=1 Tax=Kwoniella bestiolae CBS 10118 TaxID=1296100 RepID=A0A1B9FTZ7_9TREE|nr:hypothetical protein I302_07885 [Kwoniella bestiolae CBS 10118]OCF22240.1 hypothetical protein I302_07885 [Kwoniella bestiolae CBS 10118]